MHKNDDVALTDRARSPQHPAAELETPSHKFESHEPDGSLMPKFFTALNILTLSQCLTVCAHDQHHGQKGKAELPQSQNRLRAKICGCLVGEQGKNKQSTRLMLSRCLTVL